MPWPAPLERQLRRLRAYALFTYPFACVPFLFLFFRRHGIDEGGYGEIVGAYYLAMFVAEVPTGVLADRWGARPMLVLGPLLLATGFASLLVWPSYGGFLLGEVLLGIGHAVLSGPPATLLYETLHEADAGQRYLAEEARIHARRLVGTGTAFLLGGALARLGAPGSDAYELAIVATCALNLTAAALALGLRKPAREPADEPHGLLHATWRELRHPAVLWLGAYWIVLFTLLRYPFHNYQPYLAAAGREEPLLQDPLLVGVLFALLNLAAAPLSRAVPRLVTRWGRRPLFWGMPLALAASLVAMAWERSRADDGQGTRVLAWLGVAMFFVQQVPFGMHWALIQEFLNHRIGGRARTTIASVLSLGARLVYAGCNVALFHAQQRLGMAPVLLWTGVLGTAATCAVLWLRPRGLLRGQGPID